jgi:transcriptional regulator with XRE-family HTH domain
MLRYFAEGGVMKLTIGERIKIARIRRRITQVQLAKSIGISKNSLSQIESGETMDPRVSTLMALADVLGLSMDYLAGRKEDESVKLCSAAVA